MRRAHHDALDHRLPAHQNLLRRLKQGQRDEPRRMVETFTGLFCQRLYHDL
jgi:hypothetical protein